MSQPEPAAHMPPPPASLSAQAREQLGFMANAPAEMPELAQMRQLAEGMQTMIGAEQRKAHAVTVTDSVISGVPVRRIAPASGTSDRRRVLINLHGGGFATDSG